MSSFDFNGSQDHLGKAEVLGLGFDLSTGDLYGSLGLTSFGAQGLYRRSADGTITRLSSNNLGGGGFFSVLPTGSIAVAGHGRGTGTQVSMYDFNGNITSSFDFNGSQDHLGKAEVLGVGFDPSTGDLYGSLGLTSFGAQGLYRRSADGTITRLSSSNLGGGGFFSVLPTGSIAVAGHGRGTGTQVSMYDFNGSITSSFDFNGSQDHLGKAEVLGVGFDSSTGDLYGSLGLTSFGAQGLYRRSADGTITRLSSNNLGGGAFFSAFESSPTVSSVPEPDSLTMWMLGMVGMAAYVRRRKLKSSVRQRMKLPCRQGA